MLIDNGKIAMVISLEDGIKEKKENLAGEDKIIGMMKMVIIYPPIVR